MKSRQISKLMFVFVAAALVVAGCASSTSPGNAVAQDSVARVAADPDAHLRTGMTVEQVRGVLGSPDVIRPLASSEGKGETWVYAVRIPQGVNVVTGETVSRPYFDPFTNQMKEIQEPAYRKQEIVTLVERLSLLIYDGRLEKWVKTQDVEKKLQ